MNRIFKRELRIQGGNNINNSLSITNARVYNHLNIKHIVTQSEFKEYLLSDKSVVNKLFTKKKLAEINSAIFILKKRFSKYISPDSNNQISSIYASSVINRNRLGEMLDFFIGPMWAKIAMAMAEHNKLDDEILSMIKMHYKQSDTLHEKMYRMVTICDKIDQTIKPKKLLDIGIGNGIKTKQMQEILKCDVYGADIEKWEGSV